MNFAKKTDNTTISQSDYDKMSSNKDKMVNLTGDYYDNNQDKKISEELIRQLKSSGKFEHGQLCEECNDKLTTFGLEGLKNQPISSICRKCFTSSGLITGLEKRLGQGYPSINVNVNTNVKKTLNLIDLNAIIGQPEIQMKINDELKAQSIEEEKEEKEEKEEEEIEKEKEKESPFGEIYDDDDDSSSDFNSSQESVPEVIPEVISATWRFFLELKIVLLKYCIDNLYKKLVSVIKNEKEKEYIYITISLNRIKLNLDEANLLLCKYVSNQNDYNKNIDSVRSQINIMLQEEPQVQSSDILYSTTAGNVASAGFGIQNFQQTPTQNTETNRSKQIFEICCEYLKQLLSTVITNGNNFDTNTMLDFCKKSILLPNPENSEFKIEYLTTINVLVDFFNFYPRSLFENRGNLSIEDIYHIMSTNITGILTKFGLDKITRIIRLNVNTPFPSFLIFINNSDETKNVIIQKAKQEIGFVLDDLFVYLYTTLYKGNTCYITDKELSVNTFPFSIYSVKPLSMRLIDNNNKKMDIFFSTYINIKYNFNGFKLLNDAKIIQICDILDNKNLGFLDSKTNNAIKQDAKMIFGYYKILTDRINENIEIYQLKQSTDFKILVEDADIQREIDLVIANGYKFDSYDKIETFLYYIFYNRKTTRTNVKYIDFLNMIFSILEENGISAVGWGGAFNSKYTAAFNLLQIFLLNNLNPKDLDWKMFFYNKNKLNENGIQEEQYQMFFTTILGFIENSLQVLNNNQPFAMPSVKISYRNNTEPYYECQILPNINFHFRQSNANKFPVDLNALTAGLNVMFKSGVKCELPLAPVDMVIMPIQYKYEDLREILVLDKMTDMNPYLDVLIDTHSDKFINVKYLNIKGYLYDITDIFKDPLQFKNREPKIHKDILRYFNALIICLIMDFNIGREQMITYANQESSSSSSSKESIMDFLIKYYKKKYFDLLGIENDVIIDNIDAVIKAEYDNIHNNPMAETSKFVELVDEMKNLIKGIILQHNPSNNKPLCDEFPVINYPNKLTFPDTSNPLISDLYNLLKEKIGILISDFKSLGEPNGVKEFIKELLNYSRLGFTASENIIDVLAEQLYSLYIRRKTLGDTVTHGVRQKAGKRKSRKNRKILKKNNKTRKYIREKLRKKGTKKIIRSKKQKNTKSKKY
jgi:hypothetical protein